MTVDWFITLTDVAWFPQEHARFFYMVKAFTGMLSVILLVTHMMIKWEKRPPVGQRMRYFTLLSFALLITGASAEQISDKSAVNYRNVAALGVTLLLLLAMSFSFREKSDADDNEEGRGDE